MKRKSFMKVVLGIILNFVLFFQSNAQAPRFQKEVSSIVAAYAAHTHDKKETLFIGSSSFTFWKDAQNYFPEQRILNQAFGGSTLIDLIDYIEFIVPEKNLKQIVIYCGENDLAESAEVTGEIVASRFKKLYTLIRSKWKKIPIAYVSMKPSPSRVHLLDKMKKGNELIAQFLEKEKKAAFINVYDAMWTNGAITEDIFLEDRLHMTVKGYEIWQRIIQPYLK